MNQTCHSGFRHIDKRTKRIGQPGRSPPLGSGAPKILSKTSKPVESCRLHGCERLLSESLVLRQGHVGV